MWNQDQKPAFGKINALLIGIGLLVIIIGFLLMLGAPSGTTFNADIFIFRRITLAPMVELAGFLFIFCAILYKSKKEKTK